jgi:branched-chain amino acid transport system ATP-binding protein
MASVSAAEPLPLSLKPTDAAELTAQDVVVHFGGLAAIADVSLTVGRHEVFGLIGPNGAGKTTLVNCLTGFQAPTSGRVLLAREETTGWKPERFRKAGIGRTFQAGRLFREMTVTENVEVSGVGLGLGRRQARARARSTCCSGSAWRPRPTWSPASCLTPTSAASVSPAR